MTALAAKQGHAETRLSCPCILKHPLRRSPCEKKHLKKVLIFDPKFDKNCTRRCISFEEDAYMEKGQRSVFSEQESADFSRDLPILRSHFKTSERLVEGLSIIKRAIHQLLKESVEAVPQALETSHLADRLSHLLTQLDHLDVSENADETSKWHFLGQHDGLTGLPNRHFFQHHVTQFLTTHPAPFSLLFIDLDGFKEINDTFGHKMGDCLLVEVAQRLKHVVRQDDVVSRYGGDEFTILLPTSAIPPIQIVERILQALSEPFLLGAAQKECHIGASIGIALYPKDGSSYDELIQAADEAMYKAKKNGKNTYALS